MRARITRTLFETEAYINAPNGAANREPFVHRQMTHDLRADLEAQGFENIYFEASRRAPTVDDQRRYQFDVVIPGTVKDFITQSATAPFREGFNTDFEAVEDGATFEGEDEAPDSAIAAVGNMIG